MVARSMLDTLRTVGEDAAACSAVLDAMARLSQDFGEWLVFLTPYLETIFGWSICRLPPVLNFFCRFYESIFLIKKNSW